MKKIIVAMPMDERLQKQLLTQLGRIDWLDSDCSLDFVHIFKQENYPYMIPPTIYPTADQKEEIYKTIKDIFQGLTQSLPWKDKQIHVDYHESPKEGMVKYLRDNGADLVITMTRKHHRIADYFSSTFTEYLIGHAPCGVMVMRQE